MVSPSFCIVHRSVRTLSPTADHPSAKPRPPAATDVGGCGCGSFHILSFFPANTYPRTLIPPVRWPPSCALTVRRGGSGHIPSVPLSLHGSCCHLSSSVLSLRNDQNKKWREKKEPMVYFCRPLLFIFAFVDIRVRLFSFFFCKFEAPASLYVCCLRPLPSRL